VEGEERGIFFAWPQSASDEKIEALMSYEAMASLALQPMDVVAIKKWSGIPAAAGTIAFKAAESRFGPLRFLKVYLHEQCFSCRSVSRDIKQHQ
jgi:hypothetical protein